MALVYSAFVPHPPIIVPEIGRGEEEKCAATLKSFRQIACSFVEQEVETVLIISPHAPLLREGVVILQDPQLEGDFTQFRAPQVSLSFPNHQELAQELSKLPGGVLYSTQLDHGTMVPLYFLKEAGWHGKVVVMSMPYSNPEVYGNKIASILKEFSERIGILASGDLSHKLREDGPYGLHPSGPILDQEIATRLAHNPSTVKDIPKKLAEEGAECGWRSLRLALAVQEGLPQVLSYEGTFGVGYLVAELYKTSPLPHWARACLETYLKEGKRKFKDLTPPEGAEFQLQRGCFVTLNQDGNLRGCIGTIAPTRDNLAQEIAFNALAAAFEDPRFRPVEIDELPYLSISVDVLGEMEKIKSLEELDPHRYGVVVQNRGRRGLLLPHLEGIDTVEEQVSIAKQKAGLSQDESVEMWRFEVVRHFE
ncbi:MAG: AmmeMemoRadiSam system protein A [Desulfitobacterium sp.]|nr:AmmeMemoRadiSam system protein A [Desulfitobacterium sp.]